MGELDELKELKFEVFEDFVIALITSGGGAKSNFVNAIQCAREGDYMKAEEMNDLGAKMYDEAHRIHLTMIGREELTPQTQMEQLLLIHAEDQLNSAETFMVLAEEFMKLYRRLDK